jgi:hypothetical protein
VLARWRAAWWLRSSALCARWLLLAIAVCLLATSVALGQIELPTGNLGDRIEVAADGGSHWVEGS